MLSALCNWKIHGSDDVEETDFGLAHSDCVQSEEEEWDKCQSEKQTASIEKELILSRRTTETLIDRAMSRFGLLRHWLNWVLDAY